MPAYYNRTIATKSIPETVDSDNYWNPKNWLADLIIIELGSNDYGSLPFPSDEEFQRGYIELLNQLRQDYPSADIICVGGQSFSLKNIEYVCKDTNTDPKVNFVSLADTIFDGMYIIVCYYIHHYNRHRHH